MYVTYYFLESNKANGRDSDKAGRRGWAGVIWVRTGKGKRGGNKIQEGVLFGVSFDLSLLHRHKTFKTF